MKRINRNIVECKGKRKYVQLRFPDVLIETSWNVKEQSVENVSRIEIGINRNIVECKVLERAQELKQETSINRNIVECKGRLTEDIVL